MPPEELNLHISLIGVASSTTDIFSSILPDHGLPMEDGNHLRWFFQPELGFPEKFTVYRSTDADLKEKIQQWFVFDVWSTNPDDTAPFFNEQARRLIEQAPVSIAEFSFNPLEHPTDFFGKGDPSGALPPPEYHDQANAIENYLTQLCNPADLTHQLLRYFGEHHYKKTAIRPIEALLLASLDPFIARMMGLYFIDRSTDRDIHVYYVDADYGQRLYPLSNYDFRETPPSRLGTFGYKIGLCTIFHVSGRINLSMGGDSKGLLFADPFPSGRSIFYLSFDTPVEEVQVSFWGSVYGTINVFYQNGASAPGELNDNQLIISPEADVVGPFTTLNLSFEHTGRIYIGGLAWRAKRGPIGVLTSNASVIYTDAHSPLPSALDVTALRQATMPPILDDNGRLNTQISKVKIAVAPNSASAWSGSDPKPVRYVLGKKTGFDELPPNEYFYPNEVGLVPKADAAFLGLLLYFDFNNKNFVNLADNTPTIVKGDFTFSNYSFTSIDLGSYSTHDFPLFSGQQYLLLPDLNPDNRDIWAFTVGATVFPMVLAEGEYMTILDYNWQTSLWFGLLRRGDRLFVHLVLNGVTFDSVNSIALAQQPAHRLVVSYDGGQIKMYIDSAEPDQFDALLGTLAPNPNRRLAIGADINSAGEQAPQSWFNGLLSDVYCWAKAMTPHEVKKVLVDQHNDFIPREIDNPYTRNPFSYFDQFIPDNNYTYFAKGIDIFGRMSEWSRPQEITVRAMPPQPNAPQSVKARFIQWSGTIRAINERRAEDGRLYKTLHTTILGQETDFGKHEAIFTRNGVILEHWPDERTEAEIQHSGIPKGQLPYNLRQKIEIYEAPIPGSTEIEKGYVYDHPENTGQLTILDNYILPPFAPIEPGINDEILIELDKVVEVEWQWTGLQQVYNPNVERFNIYHLRGIQNQVEATVQSVGRTGADGLFELQVSSSNHSFRPNFFNNRFCDINNRSYKIIAHDGGTTTRMQVRYEGYPLIVPQPQDRLYITIQKGEPDYRDLKLLENWEDTEQQKVTGRFEPITNHLNANRFNSITITPRKLPAPEINQWLTSLQGENKIDWLPAADEHTDLWELQITGLVKPLDYQNPLPADYVPDALVAAIQKESGQQYEVLYILWRQWDDDGLLHLYTSLAQPPAHPPHPNTATSVIPRFALDRLLLFYPGRKCTQRFVLPGTIVPEGQSTEMHQVTVTAFAPENGSSGPASYASLVAVDRKKPPRAPIPRIGRFGKADYHNLSEVEISWAPNANISYYQLFRATDADIFARDLENRRLKIGSYGENMPDEQILEVSNGGVALFNAFRQKDPASFAEGLTDNWRDLTPAALFGHAKDSPGWKRVTYFWQYWAAWYYPSLTNADIQALGDRDGSESAFTLVHSSPISGITHIDRPIIDIIHTDKVNGAVNNRYYYRLRSQGLNLSQSTQWGPVSEGRQAEVPSVPPRTPVFTKVEAGDRQVTLQWALNREADLQGYVLYRSRNKDLLEDLRWFDVEFPNGNALVQRIEVPDPRIVVRNRAIVISDEVPIESIVGVYRAEEFDIRLPLEAEQPRAVDFWLGSGASLQHDARARTYRISLKRVGDGVDMVVVVRNNLGFLVLLKYTHLNYPFVDRGLLGLTTYYYKLAAKNAQKMRSKNGEIQSAKALEIEPPPAPVVLSQERVAGAGSDAVLLTLGCEDNLGLMIQARKTGEVVWTTVQDWTTPVNPQIWSISIESNSAIELKIWSRTSNKMTCEYPTYLYIHQ